MFLPGFDFQARKVLSGHAKLKPSCPTACRIPPGRVNDVIAADGKEMEVLGYTRDGGDLSSRFAYSARNVEPGSPAGGVVPPGAVDAIVGSDHEQVEVIGISGYCSNWRPG